MANGNLPGRDIDIIIHDNDTTEMPSDLMSILEQIQMNSKTVITIAPADAEIINVNLNTRQIELGTSVYSNFLSVARDHYAETIYMRVPRYFDGVDLMRMCCVVEYTNAANQNHVSPILLKDSLTEPGYLLLGWCIHGDATIQAGTVKFALRFYSLNLTTHQFVYSLRTQQATGRILYGVDESQVSEEQQAVYNKPIYDLVQALNEKSLIYWHNV